MDTKPTGLEGTTEFARQYSSLGPVSRPTLRMCRDDLDVDPQNPVKDDERKALQATMAGMLPRWRTGQRRGSAHQVDVGLFWGDFTSFTEESS